MKKRTRALRIPPSVKKAVYTRDHGLCVVCGCPGNPNAHFISRAQGGMGVEENIVTLCPSCHTAYDQSVRRKEMCKTIREYLQSQYPSWEESNLYYRK